MKKIGILTCSAMLLALAVFAQQPAESDATVVISAGDVRITKAEFEAAIDTLPEEYKAYAKGPGKRSFAHDYLRMKLLAAEALKNKLDQDPAVQRQLELMKNNTLATAQIDQIRGSAKVSDAELQKSYEARKPELEQATASHILIAFEGSPAAPREGEVLSDEAAKQKAEEIRQKLIAGSDFAELAQAESHDRGSASRGGALGTFGRGQMVPEFEAAVFEGPVGEVLPVVKTQFGYHIIRVEERKTIPLEEVREQIETEIAQQMVEAHVESLESAANAKFDESYFGPETPAAPVAEPAPAQ